MSVYGRVIGVHLGLGRGCVLGVSERRRWERSGHSIEGGEGGLRLL